MLGIFEIKSETPQRENNNKGFLYIKFCVENSADAKLLMQIFNHYLNHDFCGFAADHKPKGKTLAIALDKYIQIIRYDYESSTITVTLDGAPASVVNGVENGV